ncbi:MAG TPA: amidohydrolase family protein [Ohtaekwangia sp.]|nr:amidohydrolase family protein [Ohtaekwangia sp.]
MKYLSFFLCFAAHILAAQTTPIAFRGAYIHTATGNPIPQGILVVQNGKIVAVGDMNTTIPQGAQIVDVTGKTIMPGLVDTHSHLGGPSGGDNSGPLHPEVRVMDAVNPTDDGFKKALAGGITTINLMSGSGHLLSGQTVYVKMRDALQIEDMLLTTSKGVTGGIKMANGTNSIRATPGFPGTRSKSAALVRELFVKAQEYQVKLERAKAAPDKTPDRDLKLEALGEVLAGTRVVHFHTHTANDILTAIRLSKEFKFRIVLHHVSEAWKIADIIAENKIPCSIIVLDAPGGKLEAMEISPANGGVLEQHGVLTAYHTDDWVTDSRFLMRSAAMGIREGMTRSGALKALTINGAIMLDLADRIGSLETGKDADFVILSGDPFSVYTQVEQTWVEGVKRFDITIPADRAFAMGGYGVFSPDRAEHHAHKQLD